MKDKAQAKKRPAPKPANENYLRDHLAADRTIQANERTLLSYVRTALTMFVAGITFVRFFGAQTYVMIGYGFIPVSIIIMITGIYRYNRMRKIIKQSALRGHIDLSEDELDR